MDLLMSSWGIGMMMAFGVLGHVGDTLDDAIMYRKLVYIYNTQLGNNSIVRSYLLLSYFHS
jgi:hypothetical protein